MKSVEAEVEKLHAKIGQLVVERDFLEGFRELVAISRSGFYYQPAGETPLNLELMRPIDAQFLETPWYGSPDGAPSGARAWPPGASGSGGSWPR